MLILAGLIGYYFQVGWICLMYISASLERIILFLYPTRLLTVILTSAIYKQKLRLFKPSLAIALSYGGTVIVMLQEQSTAPHEAGFLLGGHSYFASAVCFACYLLMTTFDSKFGSWNR